MGKCLWEANRNKSQTALKRLRVSEIAACGKGQGSHPSARFVSYGRAPDMTLGRQSGEKPFKFGTCLSPMWSVDNLICPFTGSLLQQLRSLRRCPWDMEAAQRPCLSDELSKTGEGWPAALEHSLSPTPDPCLHIHLQMNVNLDRQPPPIAVLPLKMSHESPAGCNSCEWQLTAWNAWASVVPGHCPRAYPSSIFKFPTIM